MTFSSLTLAWATIIAGVAALFTIAEQSASSLTKDAVRDWLRNVDPGKSVLGLPDTFIRMFDNVFGERYLSWIFLLRCFSVSIFSLTLVSIIFKFVGLNLPYKLLETTIGANRDDTYGGILLYGCIFNFIPDFISLLETRYLLSRLGISNSSLRIVFLLFIDIILTGICFIAHLYIVVIIIGVYFGGQSLYQMLEKLFVSGGLIYAVVEDVFLIHDDSLAVFFYTTYFTSVWLWLYAISSLIVKFAYFIGIPLKAVKYVFDISNKPILALGTVSCLFITLVFVVFGPFILD